MLAVARALPILEWAPAKGRRAQAIKEKSAQANQQLGINKQVEQAEILPSVAVPDLSSAEARLHPQTVQSSPKTHPSVAWLAYALVSIGWPDRGSHRQYLPSNQKLSFIRNILFLWILYVILEY